jgi:tyrosyl-tRNA synthetase
MIDFVEELKWRGMIHDMIPGTTERLRTGPAVGYAGFDPSASSLQIGNLVPIMMLMHFQRAGHKPLALVGGATGMIGDPSGKSEERNLLSIEELRHNEGRFKEQLGKFLDFDRGAGGAEIINNYDWFREVGFLDFLRDVGKHLTVSYMIAKESVQQRLQTGISFTEFSYQLLQGYDFYWLYRHRDCVVQMGGADQWGNITAGCELIRRKGGGESYALTCPLVTKADGTKFGKSAAGERLWLDPEMTSPYRFYQFWLNCADADAGRFLRIFTLLPREQIEALEREHEGAAHTRPLQKALARDMTVRVHSEEAYRSALEASEILFGKGTTGALRKLSEREFLDVFEGVPRAAIDRDLVSGEGMSVVELLSGPAPLFGSKGEARRLIRSGGVSLNKERIGADDQKVRTEHLLNGKYLLFQKGKKNYFVVKVEG